MSRLMKYYVDLFPFIRWGIVPSVPLYQRKLSNNRSGMNTFRFPGLLLGLGVCAITNGCGGGAVSGNGVGQQTPSTPVIASVSPAKAPAGSAALTLAVTGTGFLSTSVVEVNGLAEVTTYVDSTRLTATVPAIQVASGANLSVTVSNGSVGSGAGSLASLEIDNPAPTVTSVAPTTLLTGSASPTVTVTGTGFVPATVVNVNGSARPTSFISETQVSAALTPADVASGATLTITVVNGAPGGGTAPPATVMVATPNGAPVITAVFPATLVAGSGSQTIKLAGAGFMPGTVIQVNGTPRNSDYIGGTQMSASLSAADAATAGSLALTAVNPAPGGGTSAVFPLGINNPSVGTLQLVPSTVPQGITTPTTVTVTGSTFVPASAIQVNGSSRPTTYVDAHTLTFVATVSDEATPARLAVTVVNPPPGGGTSAAAFLAVGTQIPQILSIIPNPIYAGSPDTTIKITASGLTADSQVFWNGNPLTTDNSVLFSPPGYYLTAVVPAADIATPATASVTVSTPELGPSLSQPFAISIVNPPVPTLSSISPMAAPLNTATTVTVNGSGFTHSSTVDLNGTALSTTYVSDNQLTTQLPATSLAAPNVYNITVNTPAPAPGGGTSSSLQFTAYVSIPNNSMVYNPVNGLFYLSIPSAAGPPYGNSVASIDPLTGQLGVPIPVGSEPDQLALTSDGTALWVALNGASAVRKVDLVAGVAGMQFPVVQEQEGRAAAALAALPGAPNSVVVSTVNGNIGQALAIYDSGVIRGQPVQATIHTFNPWALLVDGSKSEIYAAGGDYEFSSLTNYNTYTYNASGLTLKASSTTTLPYAKQLLDEIEIVNGRLYTDLGQVADPETGAVLGNFYSSGTVVAQGSTTVDANLGLAFVLKSIEFGPLDQFQLQSFHLSDFTATSSPQITIYNPDTLPDYIYYGATGNRLTRWGADGLALRAPHGFISLRASMVQDLSSVNADLAVTLAASGPKTTGEATTYTATLTNQGPAAASSVVLTALIPATGVLSSVSAPSGSCSTTGTVICNLGGLRNGASATVVFKVLEVSAGDSAMAVQVTASENDPATANNQATSIVTTTGSPYYLVPTLTAVTPVAIVSGSSDTQITLSGNNFSSGSVVFLNGTALATSFNSTTELTATVPAANLTRLGWAALSVANPAPGGGTSAAIPLSVFSVLALGANHIVYDPYSRQIMASVGKGTSAVAGNSIAAIQPDTASVGTPVPIGGTPTNLAISSDGQILYALLPSASIGAIARFNMLTQQPDFTASNFQATGYDVGLRYIATQPGTENTIAVDEGEYSGSSIVDFDPATKTATRRGASSGTYTGTCQAFPNASTLYTIDLYSSPTALSVYSVTSTGLVNESSYFHNTTILQDINCIKVNGDLLVNESGGVSNTSTIPINQVGKFEGVVPRQNYGASVTDFAPDASLGLAWFLTTPLQSGPAPVNDDITAFSTQTFMPVSVLTLPFGTYEGPTEFVGVDVVRWGQDGLAVLSGNGNLYLMRGAAVVPQLLQTASAPTLTASSASSIPHGSGNILLTLTGTNFLPGVAVTWNGSYRTTTVVDSAHITVALPASDLANIGTASVMATNPGSAGSNSLTISLN
jgi:hypothetical protein